MKITLETLISHNACKTQRELFARVFPDGCEVNAENAAKAVAEGLEVGWAVHTLRLTLSYADAYHKEWYRDGKRHRDDGPAVEWADGHKEWWRDGKRHRDDGPAVERADGTKVWCRDDKYHRDDGPAVECANGDKEWWRDGKYHRDDGPAVERVDGTKEWWRDGNRHRDDGR